MNKVVCEYKAKSGQEAALEALLQQLWPTLRKAGLAGDEPVQLLRGCSAEHEAHCAAGEYIEIFTWKDADSSDKAHRHPEVMAIWEGIGQACSSMKFPSFESLS